ncbi:OmpH family outer membrane protein [Cellulophaga baltica]|uniref:OmpH family outer membrane protein n=1 Tax=Cellulophaga TaxID=104264 RepID=UPI001C07A520|nr:MULTISPECIES: OmpH family outer membrane protein [Cellulophaga]MBU2995151.1 OmpH family outer membrane protein [Cellulophaga baltica]MDO6766546.1 OmpH family outer membrane protein [Cellulophaga sp. 1_MG-2023]
MKHLKGIVVAVVLFIGASSFVNAQNKVAHINVQELMSAMPEMKAAEAELKKLEETYGADIQSSMTELQNKYKQYESEAASKSDEENQKRGAELQEAQKNIQGAQQTAQQELQKKQIALLSPISDKAKAAIEKVASAQGVNYVLDSSQGSGVIVAQGTDLLPLVKKELGF